jgi:3-oxoadipate enol-lactonase
MWSWPASRCRWERADERVGALIFLHGLGSSGRTWAGQLEHFAARYHAIALDLPGYGATAPLPANHFPELADWLHEAIQAHDWQAPALVGTSYGGMILQEYMARYPAGAAAIVLTGTSPAFGRPDGDWQQRYIQARLGPLDAGETLAGLAPQIVAGLVGPGATEAGIAAAIADLAAVPEASFRTSVVTLLEFDQRANLPNLALPTLLLVGEADTNAPPHVMKKMASFIPDAQFQELAGLGHLAHLEDPRRFNAALAAFLEEQDL